MSLRIRHQALNSNSFVLQPEGALDSYSYRTFEAEVSALFTKGAKHLLVDMAGVDYISSLGLSSIIHLIKTSKEHEANFVLYNSQESIQKVLELSKLDFVQINPDSLDPTHPFFDYLQAQTDSQALKKKEDEKREKKRKRYE